VIIENSNVKIGFKIFRISFKSSLIERKALIKIALTRRRQLLDAGSNRVETINVLWIKLKDLQV